MIYGWRRRDTISSFDMKVIQLQDKLTAAFLVFCWLQQIKFGIVLFKPRLNTAHHLLPDRCFITLQVFSIGLCSQGFYCFLTQFSPILQGSHPFALGFQIYLSYSLGFSLLFNIYCCMILPLLCSFLLSRQRVYLIDLFNESAFVSFSWLIFTLFLF